MERSDKQRILVVDDDREIVAAIVRLLEREGIEAIPAYNGREAVERLTENEIHLIIIDIMMPEMDGISATIKIRTERNIPVIMLSAKTEESDKILGLSVGADDYVTKPFSPAELIARVKSQLRRYMTLGDYANRSGGSDVALGGLLLHRDQRQLDVDGEPVKLTPKEYRIVELLKLNPFNGTFCKNSSSKSSIKPADELIVNIKFLNTLTVNIFRFVNLNPLYKRVQKCLCEFVNVCVLLD